MTDEDEFDTYFRRAAERAPVKQLSQQDSPSPKMPTTATRRASLQAPDVMYSFQTAAASKRNNTSPSRRVHYETRTNTKRTSPHRTSSRRRNRQSQSDDVDRQRDSSTSPSTAAATTTGPLARHFESRSPGSLTRRHRRAKLVSIVSSPGDVATHCSDSHYHPVVGSNPVRHGRRATLAGDLLQIPPGFGGCPEVDRRSSSVSPPSSSPVPSRSSSPGARPQRATRLRMESRHPWTPITAAVGYRKASSPVAVGGRGGHVVRNFRLSAKGAVNVENAVRDDEILFDDDAVEVPTRRSERPTALRHSSSGRRISTTVDHSPRLSPQRVVATAAAVCNEMYVDQSPRRWRSEQPESPEYKVLVVGDHGVGKTELIRHFTLYYATNSTSPGIVIIFHYHHHHHHAFVASITTCA